MEQAHLYNPACEAMTRAQLEQIQIEQLQVTLNRVYGNVAFYRTAFDAHKVNLSRLKDLRALRELPFTAKEDLQKSYPYDMFAVPLRDIIRIHTTSGTTGGPTEVMGPGVAGECHLHQGLHINEGHFIVEPKSLPTAPGGAPRVVDRRPA